MSQPPKWYVPTAIAALVWNGLGCVAYLMDVRPSATRIAALTDAQRVLLESRPSWAVSATALAVWLGVLGCVALLMRGKWAITMFAISLGGVILQDVWLFGVSGQPADPVALVAQLVVLVIAALLLRHSVRAAKEGWIA